MESIRSLQTEKLENTEKMINNLVSYLKIQIILINQVNHNSLDNLKDTLYDSI
ncbi:MAG: hypothetical protein NZM44_02040 [Candidatus Calescibacterium sp.]|nr:hypothetical protein [Candidatus Calescibacterium sp.]MCX7759105.1 hypothetical protein [bacterium]